MPVEGTRFSRKCKLTLRLTFKRCMCMGLCWGFTVGGQFFQVTGAADFSGEWVRPDFKEEAVHHKNNPGRSQGNSFFALEIRGESRVASPGVESSVRKQPEKLHGFNRSGQGNREVPPPVILVGLDWYSICGDGVAFGVGDEHYGV